MPKGPIIGNQLCWFGNLRYLTKDLTDPTQKLLQQYNKREKKFTHVNVGDKPATKALQTWCQTCGIRAETINNMWARKTMINTALHELLLPEQMVMNLSGHKSAVQMRKDYCMPRKDQVGLRNIESMQHAKWAVTDANVRSRATVQMFKFLSGALPRIPKTAVEVYSKLVDQNTQRCPDMSEKLEEKVDSTRDTVESLRDGPSVFASNTTPVELIQVKQRLTSITATLQVIHRMKPLIFSN
tara:strand:+ start:87 stop:809 length:723 start_codon:yes stop_codon:yes gene_type:complete